MMPPRIKALNRPLNRIPLLVFSLGMYLCWFTIGAVVVGLFLYFLVFPAAVIEAEQRAMNVGFSKGLITKIYYGKYNCPAPKEIVEVADKWVCK